MHAICFLSIVGAFVMFILGIMRSAFHGVTRAYQRDTGTATRKTKKKGMGLHWFITVGLVLIALWTMY